jgi:hypothetical protein
MRKKSTVDLRSYIHWGGAGLLFLLTISIKEVEEQLYKNRDVQARVQISTSVSNLLAIRMMSSFGSCAGIFDA